VFVLRLATALCKSTSSTEEYQREYTERNQDDPPDDLEGLGGALEAFVEQG